MNYSLMIILFIYAVIMICAFAAFGMWGMFYGSLICLAVFALIVSRDCL